MSYRRLAQQFPGRKIDLNQADFSLAVLCLSHFPSGLDEVSGLQVSEAPQRWPKISVRVNTEKEMWVLCQGKFPLVTKKYFLYEGGQALRESDAVGEISILGGVQDLVVCDPGQTILTDPALSRRMEKVPSGISCNLHTWMSPPLPVSLHAQMATTL